MKMKAYMSETTFNFAKMISIHATKVGNYDAQIRDIEKGHVVDFYVPTSSEAVGGFIITEIGNGSINILVAIPNKTDKKIKDNLINLASTYARCDGEAN